MFGHQLLHFVPEPANFLFLTFGRFPLAFLSALDFKFVPPLERIGQRAYDTFPLRLACRAEYDPLRVIHDILSNQVYDGFIFFRFIGHAATVAISCTSATA